MWRDMISKHTERSPRVESHYCRAFTSKEYLHSVLTLPKIGSMFIGEIDAIRLPISKENALFYRRRLANCNLTLCATFDLQQAIRLPISKENALFYRRRLANCNLTLCATFDLQQAIRLPISKENALFYRRRLANCNLFLQHC
ncbi:hypothetical protein RRG08_029183 [Elysia crispata]|uniref:Uncharacterized protein n=1 Tax=Elysia crispata TaxID=231223 RepID=A0AAE1DZG8_9GAST|nr:hypothetical protein RRG08_029183 [Elysia crispata]